MNLGLDFFGGAAVTVNGAVAYASEKDLFWKHNWTNMNGVLRFNLNFDKDTENSIVLFGLSKGSYDF